MEQQDILARLRLFLADPMGKIWKDDILLNFLNEALKQYCIDTGCFTGRFDFFPTAAGEYEFPEDFAAFMAGWNSAGQEISPTTATELFHRQCRNANRTGAAEFIYDDQNQYGKFELYPLPEQHVENVTIDGFFGEINDGQYGVFLTDDFGVTFTVTSFDFAGEIIYSRIGKIGEIKDYFALICYACHLAYNSDLDMGNAETAAAWLERYRSRINHFSTVEQINAGECRSSNYF
jgi:hypothetical protein